jgi:hypothetical protein
MYWKMSNRSLVKIRRIKCLNEDFCFYLGLVGHNLEKVPRYSVWRGSLFECGGLLELKWTWKMGR